MKKVSPDIEAIPCISCDKKTVCTHCHVQLCNWENNSCHRHSFYNFFYMGIVLCVRCKQTPGVFEKYYKHWLISGSKKK